MKISPKSAAAIKKKFLEALSEGVGKNISVACAEANIGTTKLYEWRKEDPEFNEAVEQALLDARENNLDLCESKMFQKINGVKVRHKDGTVYETAPSDTMIMYYTSRQGKHRGYVERQEHTGKDGSDLGALLLKIDGGTAKIETDAE